MIIGNFNALELMRKRLNYEGGNDQRNRMIKDKRKSLNKAIMYSYQGARVQRIGDPIVAGALMNPDQLSQDYDEKILSIGFEYNYQPGDVFEWINTGTKWLIYLQDLTELAYFRGNARKCSYEISWEDKDGNTKTTYAAIVGPKETSIKSIQKSNFNIDLPNYTLHLLLPNKEYVLDYFQRYSKFYLKGMNEYGSKICWEVEAIDSITTPGILEIYATENYANRFEDDIENGIVGGLIVESTIEEEVSEIVGDTFIKPKMTYTYTYQGKENANWLFDNTLPIETVINEKEITIKWIKTYSGQFDLCYGNAKKTIVIESLF